MKFLTRLLLLLIVLVIIYVCMRMLNMVPDLLQIETDTREKPKKMSISIDSFLQVQQLRKKQLRKYCSWFQYEQYMNFSGPADYLMSSLSINHQLMLLYCKPHDVVINGWEEFLLTMKMRPDITIKNPLPVDTSDDQLTDDIPDMLTHLLQTYSKILFVANPYERLASLYLKSKARKKSFKVFIEGILQKETRVDGFSTSSVLTLCYPCSVKYDYIVLVNFAEVEIPHMLRRIGVPESVALPSFDQTIKATSWWLTKRLYKGLPKKQLRRLTKLYSWDFTAFPLRNILAESRAMTKIEI